MFINKLKILRFKGFNEFDLTFSKPNYNYFEKLNLSILVGENGTGKSTILQALTQIFCPTERNKKPNRLEIDFQISYDIDGMEVYYQSNEKYPDYFPPKIIVSTFSVFDPFTKYSYFPTRIKYREKESSNHEANYVYCGPLESRHSSLDSVVNAIIKTIYFSEADIKQQKCYYDLLHKTGYREAVWFEFVRNHHILNKKVNELYNEASLDIAREYYEKLMLLIRQKKFRIPPQGLSAGRALISVEDFGKELSYLYYKMLDLDLDTLIKDIWFVSLDDQIVPLSDMSSGQLTMLFRFLPLTVEMDDNALVLIDEPETHLHPLWEQEFIEYLVQLFNEFNSHIIIATHSPIIASDVPMESIIGLINKNGQLHQLPPMDRTLGGHASEILRDVFHLDKITGKFSSKKLLLIEELILSKDTVKIEKARRIYNDLSTTMEKYELFKKYKDILGD
ncbi:AAA family ATPase [Bacillus sp. FSL K6-6540]|uniref:AAA family ATPase n=1 Tax=Bacillus sp. FSL K6-6540 TaxID=2921512 RepID=UPI0030FD0EA1